jgi:hypothetical protein
MLQNNSCLHHLMRLRPLHQNEKLHLVPFQFLVCHAHEVNLQMTRLLGLILKQWQALSKKKATAKLMQKM